MGRKDGHTVRMRNGFPKSSGEKNRLLLEDDWLLIHEPKNIIQSIFFSLPLMVLLGLISMGLMYLFSPLALSDYGFQEQGFVIAINILDVIMVIVFILVHELIHLMLIPNFLKSDKTAFGFTWFGGYAYTEEIISRERYILIAVMPYLLISVVGVIAGGVTGQLTPLVKFICIINAIASSVDFLNVALIIKQAPRQSKIIMNGQLSYYKAI